MRLIEVRTPLSRLLFLNDHRPVLALTVKAGTTAMNQVLNGPECCNFIQCWIGHQAMPQVLYFPPRCSVQKVGGGLTSRKRTQRSFLSCAVWQNHLRQFYTISSPRSSTSPMPSLPVSAFSIMIGVVFSGLRLLESGAGTKEEEHHEILGRAAQCWTGTPTW